jgi:hypothetical protein
MRRWHDFRIVGYAASGALRRLTFELDWPYDSAPPAPVGQLAFIGVESYFLEQDLGENIVYSFAEVPLRGFLEQWQSRFEHECRWGWPKFWRPTPHPLQPVEQVLDEALAYLCSKNIKCVELSSSCGLSGWVLAASIEEPSVEA